ncbi:hypothetical protein HII27_09230 [Kluyvera sp. SCKS090646]|uniref:Uncharacterized protein n=1 Tax=Kluyvera sichuanensis TaxID=2725494 RepID=A0ABR6RRY3_9ENTR|nr:hypothetical protein [Kluyvera sichuanensis]MBC1185898.1 hypothetical protein [Kluyvera sichuanensis]
MNKIGRPLPSPAFVAEFAPHIRLIPTDGLWEWVQEHIIADGAHLHNPDHFHLATTHNWVSPFQSSSAGGLDNGTHQHRIYFFAMLFKSNLTALLTIWICFL